MLERFAARGAPAAVEPATEGWVRDLSPVIQGHGLGFRAWG